LRAVAQQRRAVLGRDDELGVAALAVVGIRQRQAFGVRRALPWRRLQPGRAQWFERLQMQLVDAQRKGEQDAAVGHCVQRLLVGVPGQTREFARCMAVHGLCRDDELIVDLGLCRAGRHGAQGKGCDRQAASDGGLHRAGCFQNVS
jgi:hypothetical protein